MQQEHSTFMGRRIIISETCDIYDSISIRRHRKKRLRKKFLKKYGTRRVLVSSDAYVLRDGTIVMGPHAYHELKKQALQIRPTGGLF